MVHGFLVLFSAFFLVFVLLNSLAMGAIGILLILIILGMMALGVLILKFSWWLSRRDQSTIIAILKSELEAGESEKEVDR